MAVPTEVLDALARIAAGSTADDVESRTLDFKRQGRSGEDTIKDLAEAAACFANSLGGFVVVGVQDRISGPEAVKGTDLDPDRVARRVYELTQPSLTVQVEEHLEAGMTLLVISVPRSSQVHQVDNRATRRLGTACERMDAEQIASLIAERRGDDWSAVDTGVPLTAVSAVAMDAARRLLEDSPDPTRRGYAGESDQDLLRILGVVSPEQTLLRAGLLLLGDRALVRNLDLGDLIVYQFRRTPAGELALLERLSGPLLTALLRALDLFSARVDKTPVNLPHGQQIHLADLPETAAREAVANAVMHRDYRLHGPIQIEHSPTRFAVTSPGPLVNGVTVENILTTSSRPRNPRLAAAMRTLGLAEEAGVGVDRMYREMVRIGHQPPQYLEELDRVRVTLLGGAPNAYLARYIATLPQVEADDADVMIILYTLLSSRLLNAEQAAPLLQKKMEEAESVLRRLSSEQVAMIEPNRETARRAHPSYRLREHVVSALGPVVIYRRRTPDEYDRKIIELAREAGQVNARMVKIALDVETGQASQLLSDLVRRGVLVKTSKSQRGRLVTYGPGPQFPTRTRTMRARDD